MGWPFATGPTASWPPDRRWLALVLLFVVSLPAVTPRVYASDEIQYFAYLRSLWFDRDLSFDNEYRYFYDRGIGRAHRFQETFLELSTPTGRRINFATIGCALLWAPFYGVADLLVRAMRAMGSPVAADGFARPYIAAVTYGSAVYGFLAVVLSVLIARRMLGTGHAAAALVWLGTPLLFYMYVAPGMAHACSAFAVAAFVLAWLIVRARWSRGGLIALGALAALVAMVREQDLFFALGPAADFGWTLARTALRERRLTAVRTLLLDALTGAATFAICFLPQAVSYLVLNGRLGPSQFVEAKMRWTAPHVGSVLLSPEHGLFFWTPLALLCLAGLVLLAVRGPRAAQVDGVVRRIALCLLLMFAAQVYISGSVDTWTVAGAFGQRRFVGTTALLVVGLAALLQTLRGTWGRVALAATCALCIWWNLGLIVQFGAGTMDRQRLELARNAYNSFVVVPQTLPRLAYRYLFNRPSFYQSPDRYETPR